MRFALIVLLLTYFSAEAEKSRFSAGVGNSQNQQEALIQGNASAVEICNTLTWSRSDCFEIIAGKTMNDSAVQLCGTLFNKLDCLRIIVGKTINDSAVQFCGTLFNKLDCLRIIAGKTISDSTVQRCGQSFNKMGCLRKSVEDGSSVQTGTEDIAARMMINILKGSDSTVKESTVQSESEQAKNEAVEFCRNEVRRHSRDDCLEIVAPARFVDRGALKLCKNQSYHDHIDCLSAIVNKEYSPGLIEECGEKSRHRQMDCLAKYGSLIMDDSDQEESRQAKNEAVEFCRNEVRRHSRDDCLEIVAPARFVDRGALKLCKNQSYHDHIDCLSAIVNKEYSPGLIEECGEKSRHRQMDCLAKYGSLIMDDSDQPMTVIVIQNGNTIQSFPPECDYENFHGLYPEGGGCDFHGCWVAGGGCNFHGCWYPGGHCNIHGCVNEAPTTGICRLE